MNKFSQTIHDILIQTFPQLKDSVILNGEYLELEILNKTDVEIGNLIIQTSEENNIWIRISQPHSGYNVNDSDELIKIIKGTMSDKILWVISYKDNLWNESTLIENLKQLVIENRVQYFIYSWSGKLDSILPPLLVA